MCPLALNCFPQTTQVEIFGSFGGRVGRTTGGRETGVALTRFSRMFSLAHFAQYLWLPDFTRYSSPQRLQGASEPICFPLSWRRSAWRNSRLWITRQSGQ